MSNICGECIELCQSIIDQEKKRRAARRQAASNIPSPRSIKERLDQYVIGQAAPRRSSRSPSTTTTSA